MEEFTRVHPGLLFHALAPGGTPIIGKKLFFRRFLALIVQVRFMRNLAQSLVLNVFLVFDHILA